MYVSIRKFNDLLSDSTKELIFLMQGMVTSYAVVCNYIIFAHFPRLDAPQIFFFTFLSCSSTNLWFVSLQTMTSCYSVTKKTNSAWKKRQWRDYNDGRVMKKFDRTVKPMEVKCGLVYNLHPKRPLLFLQNVIIITGRLLIAFQ